ncbi:hypothetical protein IPC600_32425, partial [Pseudomonas aeruginosa]
GVPGAAPVGHPFAGRDFIVKATLLSASGRRTYLFAVRGQDGRATLLSASGRRTYLFAVRGQDGSEFTLTDRDLTDTGYAVVPRGNCAAELSFKGGWSGYAACAGRSASVRVTVVPDTSRLPRSIN